MTQLFDATEGDDALERRTIYIDGEECVIDIIASFQCVELPSECYLPDGRLDRSKFDWA